MAKTKRGKGAARRDMWTAAGGKEVLVKFFKTANINQQDTIQTAPIWHTLSSNIFGQNTQNNRQWLYVVWRYNRRDVKTIIQKEDTSADCMPSNWHPRGEIQGNPKRGHTGHERVKTMESETDAHPPSDLSVQSEADYVPPPSDLSVQSETDVHPPSIKGTKDDFRKMSKSPPKIFKLLIEPKIWKQISPLKGINKLRRPWTHYMYQKFRKITPCCPLRFTYQHVRAIGSRKRQCPYIKLRAKCIFPSCGANYKFTITRKPLKHQYVPVTLCRSGEILHSKSHQRFRQASNIRRGAIARSVIEGVSKEYYNRLRNTPVEELVAGNITHSLSKNILKVISHEIKKNMQLHDNILLETQLTQSIIRQTDTSFYNTPGYVHNFQVDPFGAHLYTETGMTILAHCMRKTPVTLYLDATGSVISIPNQKKKILYYALNLPGGGRDAPPLPVSEMISSEHSVPPITFWLMQFLLKLSTYTTVQIHRVETDYSWSLMQAVLLSFNKESVLAYLESVHAICQRQKKWSEIRSKTILHLCAAHVIKSVSAAFHRKTSDKGLKAFATFVFARLQNTVCVDEALEIFKALCVALLSRYVTASVSSSVAFLRDIINQDVPMQETTEESPNWEAEEKTSRTITGGSPYSRLFRSMFEAVLNTLEEEAHEEVQLNVYYCPGIVTFLLENYMPIFPLWSGILLGDLKRYSVDFPITLPSTSVCQTRDTNCHAEIWFGIVKNSILGRRRKLRPAEFITTMYTSLKGRYREYILKNSLPQDVFTRPKKSSRDVSFAEERWAKRSGKRTKRKSRYFSAPDEIPMPQTKRFCEHSLQDAVQMGATVQKRGICKTLPKRNDVEKDATEVVTEYAATVQQYNKGDMGKITTPKITSPKFRDAAKDNTKIDAEEIKTCRQKSKQCRKQNASKYSDSATAGNVQEEIADEVAALWRCEESEQVVAQIKAVPYKFSIVLRQADLLTLRPHELLNSEVMESYIRAVLNKHDKPGRLYQLSHYITGVILYGTRDQVARQSLKQVNFESFDGLVSFVNVRNNHWMFVHLHVPSKQIFIVDPATAEPDVNILRAASQKFQQYFRMHLNQLEKEEWVNIQWKPGHISHTVQNDATSCGVFVLQMAKETVQQFPDIPDTFYINPSRDNIEQLRLKMAVEIFLASESKEDYCSICALKDLPQRTNTDIIDWVQCEKCARWFHSSCVGFNVTETSGMNSPWFCVLCKIEKKS